MPSAPTRKPETQNTAAVNMAARGPFRSTHVPNTAAESPSITIAIEKMIPIAGQAGVEVVDQGGLVDAGRVGLADAQVDGEGRRRDEPSVESRLRDDALAGQEARNCHVRPPDGTDDGQPVGRDRMAHGEAGRTLRRCAGTRAFNCRSIRRRDRRAAAVPTWVAGAAPT